MAELRETVKARDFMYNWNFLGWHDAQVVSSYIVCHVTQTVWRTLLSGFGWRQFGFWRSFIKGTWAQRRNEISFPFYLSRLDDTLDHYAFRLERDITEVQDRGRLLALKYLSLFITSCEMIFGEFTINLLIFKAMLSPLKPFQIQWVLDNTKWLTTCD